LQVVFFEELTVKVITDKQVADACHGAMSKGAARPRCASMDRSVGTAAMVTRPNCTAIKFDQAGPRAADPYSKAWARPSRISVPFTMLTLYNP